jgi:putative phosphoesterase
LLLGIVADSHDNLPKIEAAVAKLNALGVDLVLHAGDYCSPFAALRFRELNSKLIGVFGNNDAEKDLLKAKFESLGHEVRSRFLSLEIDELRIGLLHGDEENLLEDLARSQSYDLIISGHTHSISRSQRGKSACLNPGEVCGYLSGRATIATFETSTRTIEIFDI